LLIDTNQVERIERKALRARKKVLEMCVSANHGHLTSAFSCADILAVLYDAVLRVNPKEPLWEDRDRLIMSKNHGSVMQYPFLAETGFFAEAELFTYMQNGSRLGGHSKSSLDGVDFSGGSLGIGMGVACGLAYAAKMDHQSWYTFAIVGDGESYEGSIWEAAMFAGHNRLKNLVVILDRNNLCCTDFTARLLSQEPYEEKWQAFGWDTVTVDGHSAKELLEVLSDVRERKSDKPLCVVANTVKGKGLDFIENEPLWHGRVPSGELAERAFRVLTGEDAE